MIDTVRSGGRPPWERGAAGVGGDAEAGGSDVSGENRVLANGVCAVKPPCF